MVISKVYQGPKLNREPITDIVTDTDSDSKITKPIFDIVTDTDSDSGQEPVQIQKSRRKRAKTRKIVPTQIQPLPQPEPQPDFIRKKESIARLKALPKSVQMAIDFIRDLCEEESDTTPTFFEEKPSKKEIREFERKLRVKGGPVPNTKNFNIAAAIFKDHIDKNERGVLPISTALVDTKKLTWELLQDSMREGDFETLWFTFEAIDVLLSKYRDEDVGSDILTEHLVKVLTKSIRKKDSILAAVKKLMLTFSQEYTEM